MNVAISAIVASAFVAVVMTAADWVWATQLLKHKALYGLVHGAWMCGAMGLVIGVAVGINGNVGVGDTVGQ